MHALSLRVIHSDLYDLSSNYKSAKKFYKYVFDLEMSHVALWIVPGF